MGRRHRRQRSSTVPRALASASIRCWQRSADCSEPGYQGWWSSLLSLPERHKADGRHAGVRRSRKLQSRLQVGGRHSRCRSRAARPANATPDRESCVRGISSTCDVELQDPPPDPFEGMSPDERKRAQETAILEMAYDLSRYYAVEPGERPDFTLTRSENSQPFGVEITQLFPNESIARLNLVHGYHHRLWSGGSHLHKMDRKILKAEKLQIRDKDGNIKQTDVPGVFVETPGLDAFRRRLRQAIEEKRAKGYEAGQLMHMNLVILDWFDLAFNPSDYYTDWFFDDEIRAALRDSPFREVYLLVRGASGGGNGDGVLHPNRWVIPLQQLLIMERACVTGHMIDQEFGGGLRDTAHLSALTVDHVSRVQGFGEPIEVEGRTFLRHRGTDIEISERGMQVRDHQDFRMEDCATVTIDDRLPAAVEGQVAKRAVANVFRCGYAGRARKSSTWLAN